MLDAQEGVTDQDTHLLGQILEQGRAFVIAVNKWDGLSQEQRQHVRYHLTRKLHFIDFAKTHFISARQGQGIHELFHSANQIWQVACLKISTPRLNQTLQQAMTAHQPPLIRGRRIKLRYIHQAGQNPPWFIVHGNQVDEVPENYKQYLINFFRNTFSLEGTPIRLEFRQGKNPYQHHKNVLTTRQQKKRRRLLEHIHKR
jgi:GTP-binding protein